MSGAISGGHAPTEIREESRRRVILGKQTGALVPILGCSDEEAINPMGDPPPKDALEARATCSSLSGELPSHRVTGISGERAESRRQKQDSSSR